MRFIAFLCLVCIYKLKNYWTYSNYTFGNVIKSIDEFNGDSDDKKHQPLLSEYIVEYMVNGELYKDNYYGRQKEGINKKIYYNKKTPEKFKLSRF